MIEIEKNSRTDQLDLKVNWPSVVYSPPTENIYFFFTRHETDSWIRMLNNRFGQVRLSYIFLIHYLNKGIPDEEWCVSPGRGDLSVEYFPHFVEETYYYKTMFDYYTDTFYYKFCSAWDTVFHIINAHYQFNIEQHNNRFKHIVKRELKSRNEELYNIIVDVETSNSFRDSNKLRNDITHNFAPNDISSGITKVRRDGVIKRIDMSIGNYTPSKEFVRNINALIIDILEFLPLFKLHLESHTEKS
jgi:hypothetical protein